MSQRGIERALRRRGWLPWDEMARSLGTGDRFASALVVAEREGLIHKWRVFGVVWLRWEGQPMTGEELRLALLSLQTLGGPTLEDMKNGIEKLVAQRLQQFVRQPARHGTLSAIKAAVLQVPGVQAVTVHDAGASVLNMSITCTGSLDVQQRYVLANDVADAVDAERPAGVQVNIALAA